MSQRSDSIAYPIAWNINVNDRSRELNFRYVEAMRMMPAYRRDLGTGSRQPSLRIGENSCGIALVNFPFTGNSRSYVEVESS